MLRWAIIGKGSISLIRWRRRLLKRRFAALMLFAEIWLAFRCRRSPSHFQTLYRRHRLLSDPDIDVVYIRLAQQCPSRGRRKGCCEGQGDPVGRNR